jgi:ribose transport system substrate-binding protein
MSIRLSLAAPLAAFALLAAGCGNKSSAPADTSTSAASSATTSTAAATTSSSSSATSAASTAAAPRKLVIGFVAKSNSNAVFQVAKVGAEAAAKELSKQYNMDISIDWRTPDKEDAQQQADNIEALTALNVAGIAVSCSDANKVTDAINSAVRNGIPVVTFDSDAPKSNRFAIYGTDDEKCGQEVMAELAKIMGGKGVVAILAGNPNAPNLQKRVAAALEEAKKYPGITVLPTVHHVETPADAASAVETEMQAHPEITGWAMVGGWPLFTTDALKWTPGTVKVVAVDALPEQLAYVRDGHVQELLAQQCYEWGNTSVHLLVDKILNHKTPPQPFVDSPLIPVTKDNVDAYAKNWDVWLPKQ